jgi:RNA polymerase sigma factor (sigma-70 family)
MAISVGTNRRILGRERGVARRRSAGQRVGALFDEFAPMVLAVCRYQLRDPQAAEDAAQETFLSAHRSLLGGTRPRDPAAWLATIARNECRRARRTASTAPLDEETAQSLVDPADVVAHRADLSDVASAIADLPDRQREALVLREFCGLSYEQVAAAMSVSGAAVDSLLSRARRRLVEQLGDIPRVAQGVLVVPASLREELSRSISGLDAAGAAAGAGAGGAATIAGLGSAPVAAKVAATGAAALVLAVPLQTLRADGPRGGERPRAAARDAGPELRSAGAPVARAFPVRVTRQADSPSTRPAARTNTRRDREEREHDNSGPGSRASGFGSDSSGPGPGPATSPSDSSGPGPGPKTSGSSGPGPSVSGSSGSGSSGSGSGGSGSSGSGSSGSGSSGSGWSGSGSGSGGSGGGSGSGSPDGS